jgi:hypothetical protein
MNFPPQFHASTAYVIFTMRIESLEVCLVQFLESC